MTRQRRGLPALVVGLLLGLVLGGAGAAVAAPPSTKAIKKIVTKQVKKLAPTLTVARAGNADALGGAPASAYLKTSGVRLDGTATSGDLTITSSSSFSTVLTKAVTVPTDGYVLASATLTAFKGGAPGGTSIVDYGLALDGTPLTTDGGYHSMVTTDAVFQASGAISSVVAVTAGTHTFTLLVRDQGTGSSLRGRDLSLVFAPSGSGPVLPY